jgi:hypothetical protein
VPGVSYDGHGNGLQSHRRRKLVHDLIGERFGLLTVLRHEGYRGGHATWLCRCDCGGERVTTTGLLRLGRRRSCGCLRHSPRFQLRHGHCGSGFRSPYWRRWTRVRGRGKCCKRWLRGSFELFMGDVIKAIGEPPPGAWLVRPNTRRAWSASNVQWMSPEEARARKQLRGKRRARRGGAK